MSFLFQARNVKAIEPSYGTSRCGITTFPREAPIALPPEYTDFSDSIKIKNPQNLEKETRSQSTNQLWKDARSIRITSSNFGRILNRKAEPTDKFLGSLFNSNITAIPLEYGKRNESKSKAKYLSTFKSRHLHECQQSVCILRCNT